MKKVTKKLSYDQMGKDDFIVYNNYGDPLGFTNKKEEKQGDTKWQIQQVMNQEVGTI